MSHVKSEYERYLKVIGEGDPYAGQTTIGIRDVLRAHFLLAEFFVKTGEGLGGLGPKDVNLLHSALNRQLIGFGGASKWSDRFEICATLMYGLIKNHPFHDANKRTAFLVSILHLQKIGRTPTLTGEDYENFTVDIADNKLGGYPYFERTSGSLADREVDTIARFLRRHTREIDLRGRVISYRELDAIVHRHGIRLENPYHNRIDVMRFLSESDLSPLAIPYRIAHIGFHGWTREVSRKDIHIVRGAAKLTIEHGYDSQAFFAGVDDPLTLIRKYKEPLRNLAFR